MMEQRESVGNMLFQAAKKPAGWVLLEEPGKRFASRGPCVVDGQMKWSDWRTSGGVGRSLILFGCLMCPHVLDRDYDPPADIS